MSDFAAAMRRIVTADDAEGRSFALLSGGPSATSGQLDLGGLFEIWHEVASGPIDPRDQTDLSPGRAALSPASGCVRTRWFVVQPLPEGVPAEQLNAAARARFSGFDAEVHLTDQTRHPAMHRTDTLDVICLLQGRASLVLDTEEISMEPGQVVIQRGTSHAWRAHGGPALFLAVLIDRAPGAHS